MTTATRAPGVVPPNAERVGLAPEGADWGPPAIEALEFVQPSGRKVSVADWPSLRSIERLHVLKHFAVVPDRAELEGCKYLHHDPATGDVVWKGVASAMADLLRDATAGAIEPALALEAYEHLADHYREFKKAPPAMPPACKGVPLDASQFARGHLEIKAIDDKARTFEGLASTWDLDLGMDVIHPGAFADTIKEWKRSGKTMPLLDSHNYGSVLSVVGKLVDAKETKAGLWTKWEVIGGDDGDKILERLRAGVIDSMSIGYVPKAFDFSEEEDDDGPGMLVRNLRKVELKEVSLVVFPMNPNAVINLGTVKSLTAARALEPAERATLETLHTELGRLLSAPPAGPPSPKGSPNEPEDEDSYNRLAQLRVQRLRLNSR